jgi:type IV fimbrial biogenesis protein FimT
MRNTPRGARGLTLLELMVGIAIVGTLVAIAVPSFQQFSRSQTLSARINALHQDLGYARAEAVKLQQTVRVEALKTWDDGWTVYADANANGKRDGAEAVLREQDEIAEGYSMSVADGPGAAAADFAFDRRGALAGRDAVNVAVCAKGWSKGEDKQYARNLRISANGRAETGKGKGNGKGISC